MKDLCGQKIGFLEVISKNEEDERTGIYWTCKCNCPECTKRRTPKLVSIRQDKLLLGRTRSCGYNKDLQETRSNRNTNTFSENGDNETGYTYRNEQFLFDKEDFDLVKAVSICWHINDGGYVEARDMREMAERYATTGRRKMVYLKDIIMDRKPGERVEYIDSKSKHDNRKQNLRKILD